MNTVRAIIWKETHSFLRKKLQLGIIVLTPLLLSVFLSRFKGAFFLITTMAVVFMGVFYFSWMSFQEEQLNKTISNLLASPIRVSEFFLGKILAIFIFTYLLELVALVISASIMWFKLGELPSASALLWALVTIPIWGIVLTELLGLAYILFGNPYIIRFIMILGMVSIINPALTSKIYALISSPITPTVFGIGMALLLYILMGRISKERMRKI
jgi:ABC-2 type transport system permease protein